MLRTPLLTTVILLTGPRSIHNQIPFNAMGGKAGEASQHSAVLQTRACDGQ